MSLGLLSVSDAPALLQIKALLCYRRSLRGSVRGAKTVASAVKVNAGATDHS